MTMTDPDVAAIAEREAIVLWLREHAEFAGAQRWSPFFVGWKTWWRSVRVRRAKWDRATILLTAKLIARGCHRSGESFADIIRSERDA